MMIGINWTVMMMIILDYDGIYCIYFRGLVFNSDEADDISQIVIII